MRGDTTVMRQSGAMRSNRWWWEVATNDVVEPNHERGEYPMIVAGPSRTWLGATLRAWRWRRHYLRSA